jgi:hypothetical protein
VESGAPIPFALNGGAPWRAEAERGSRKSNVADNPSTAVRAGWPDIGAFLRVNGPDLRNRGRSGRSSLDASTGDAPFRL